MHRYHGCDKLQPRLLFHENRLDNTSHHDPFKNSAKQYRQGQREIESASEKEEIYIHINFDKNLAATRRERENKRGIRGELVCNIFHGWMETTMVSLWRIRPFPRTRQMKFHSGKHHPGQRHICEKDDTRAKPMRSPWPPIPSPLAPPRVSWQIYSST